MFEVEVVLMGLFSEFVSNSSFLVTKPLSLCRIACLIGARVIGVVTLSWLHIVKTIVYFHVDMGWKTTIWTIALLSLPMRILMALQREKLLEDNLREVQIQLENIMWEKQEVEEHLQAALKDRQVMEAMLVEVEDEQDKTSAKIEELESALQDLREENLRLKEIRGKDLWGSKVPDVDSQLPLVAEHGLRSWNSDLKGGGRMAVHGKEWGHEDVMKLEKSVLLKPGSKAARIYPFSPRLISTNMAVEEAVDERRYTAVLQSLFSTLLSILVGMIVWEAKDPCMPLVVALFTVVGISLKSVVQFFSTIKVKPASDAVGLLSFNCFILGTITYPTLPAVARMLLPPTLRLATRMIRWFAFST
ncbi:hypothetical protein H6P81_005827 [Aristolochia fimbriata]|uniref:Uncharacterized protein n=1 Tax=Aristolochia fimbriata TaxID=158543 RepID=A0AAV7EW22_ARIFI|nr:hypothetical protein H6P81_005827 [Aristolochia fimbriata]